MLVPNRPTGTNAAKIKQSGFTIIELIIASAAFSTVLIIASAASIQIGKLYYKGLIQSETQEAARNVSEEITRSIQYASTDKIDGQNNPTQNQFCIGDTRYTYKVDQQVKNGDLGLRVKRLNAGETCSGGAEGKELLGDNMRLLNLVVEPIDSGKKVYKVNISIAYGDNDLLSHYNDSGSAKIAPPDGANCKPGAGSQFCAVSQLDNIVRKRLN
jgi:prepilin-type N-terminal cleavage/methylation domain-containing protein